MYKIWAAATKSKNTIRRLRWAWFTVAVACEAGTLDASGRMRARRERSFAIHVSVQASSFE